MFRWRKSWKGAKPWPDRPCRWPRWHTLRWPCNEGILDVGVLSVYVGCLCYGGFGAILFGHVRASIIGTIGPSLLRFYTSTYLGFWMTVFVAVNTRVVSTCTA